MALSSSETDVFFDKFERIPTIRSLHDQIKMQLELITKISGDISADKKEEMGKVIF